MYVEERHDAQRHVVAGQRVAARDVLRGDRQVRVRQGNAFGASGAAARVQHERDVVGRRRRDRVAAGHPRQPDGAGGIDVDLEDGHANAGGAAGGLTLSRRHDEDLRNAPAAPVVQETVEDDGAVLIF